MSLPTDVSWPSRPTQTERPKSLGHRSSRFRHLTFARSLLSDIRSTVSSWSLFTLHDAIYCYCVRTTRGATWTLWLEGCSWKCWSFSPALRSCACLLGSVSVRPVHPQWRPLPDGSLQGAVARRRAEAILPSARHGPRWQAEDRAGAAWECRWSPLRGGCEGGGPPVSDSRVPR